MMTARGSTGDALARLPPAQVKEMREGFQILDRDSDGQVTRDDVVDMLTNLGKYRREVVLDGHLIHVWLRARLDILSRIAVLPTGPATNTQHARLHERAVESFSSLVLAAGNAECLCGIR